MHKLQLIYLEECRLQPQKLRLLLLHHQRLQSLGELNQQKLQNHLLTRQLQVCQALVYFLECQWALLHNNQQMIAVNNPKILPSHLNKCGVHHNRKRHQLTCSGSNLLHLIQAFHSLHHHQQNNKLHRFLNMDKVPKSNNLQMPFLSWQIWEARSLILSKRHHLFSSSQPSEKKPSLVPDVKTAKLIHS